MTAEALLELRAEEIHRAALRLLEAVRGGELLPLDLAAARAAIRELWLAIPRADAELLLLEASR